MSAPSIHALDGLVFDNRLTRGLPADPDKGNTRRQVHRACYSRVQPTAVARPRLIAYAHEVAEELGLTREACLSEQFRDVFSGNRLLEGMDPYATCYGGHQFGQWAGQLGDGRAINLGEAISRGGQHRTLQLKGAGPTPYSRRADGRAVLRSSVREFLCSEAMHHLGVPTTRALSLVSTGDAVVRDMFYDGRPKEEPGAVVCRVAPTFTRFGNFQIHAARKEEDLLKQLVDYTIRSDFPHLDTPSPEVYLEWFREVCKRTAEMIVHWMRVGFVHGVMNTDNMSILGLTIDYGPYGWLENFDPNWTPNTTDAGGRRYRFGNQPEIAQWNLAQFAQSILPLIGAVEPLQEVLNGYTSDFQQGWQVMMAAKLGWERFEPETDAALVSELLALLELVETDMTLFHRRLAEVHVGTEASTVATDTKLMGPLMDAYYVPDQLSAEYRARLGSWLRAYQDRVRKDAQPDLERKRQMNAVNPKYVLRNYLAQLAIDRAELGDDSMIHQLLELLRDPYGEQAAHEHLSAKRPDWARHREGCSMLSCSS